MDEETLVGVIICKADSHGRAFRGYIGMLAVDNAYRNRQIGLLPPIWKYRLTLPLATKLVQLSIKKMIDMNCNEVFDFVFSFLLRLYQIPNRLSWRLKSRILLPCAYMKNLDSFETNGLIAIIWMVWMHFVLSCGFLSLRVGESGWVFFEAFFKNQNRNVFFALNEIENIAEAHLSCNFPNIVYERMINVNVS